MNDIEDFGSENEQDSAEPSFKGRPDEVGGKLVEDVLKHTLTSVVKGFIIGGDSDDSDGGDFS